MKSGRRVPTVAKLIYTSALGMAGLVSADSAWANCIITGTTVACDSSSPNPYVGPISGTSITVASGAQVQGDPYAGAGVNYDTITVSSGGQLNAQSGSTVLNSFGGNAVSAGAGATINVDGTVAGTNGGVGVNLRQGAHLNVSNGGLIADQGDSSISGITVLLTGTGATIQVDGVLRYSALMGGSVINMISRDLFANTVLGSGTVNIGSTGKVMTSASFSPAIVLTSGSTLNVAGLIESPYGAIDYRGTAGGTATVNILPGGTVHSWFSPAIMGATGAMNLTVAGALVTDNSPVAIQLGDADDTVTLVTGASISGIIDGGGGFNTLSLTGAGAGQLGPTNGFASLVVNSGTWTMAAPFASIGGVNIAPGATAIGSASQWLAPIANEGTLIFNQAVDESYTGTLTGSGQLVKTGPASLSLGDLGGFTGPTLVAAGTLTMTGAMPSVVTVANSGTLAGNGSIGGLAIQSGGTVSPGAASGSGIGTLTIAGNYAQAAGSTYLAQVLGNTADKIAVNGTASLAPGSKLVLAAQNPAFGQSYTLLTADGGLAGQYAVVQSDAPYRLSYSGSSVIVTFGRANLALLGLAQGANQLAVAGAIVSLPDSSALHANLALAQDDATVQAAYPQLTGEIHGAVRGAIVRNAEMLADSALARNASGQQGVHFWGNILGGTGHSDAAGGAQVSRRTFGGVLGLEGGAGPLTVGLAAAYINTRLKAVTGTASINSPGILAYARGTFRDLSVRAGLGYAWALNDVSRQVNFTGFSDSDKARYHGGVLHGFAEMGVPVRIGAATVTPFAAGRVYRLAVDAFAEQGGLAALRGQQRANWSEMSELGARLVTPVSRSFAAQARLSWQHRYGADLSLATLAFVAGGSDFMVQAAPLPRDAAALDCGLLWTGVKGIRFDIGYHGLLGDKGVDHIGRLDVSLPL